MLEEKFGNNLLEVVKLVEAKLPNTAYVSVLLFKEALLIKSINNNYNNWSENYNEADMSEDNVFFEISHKNLKQANSTLCFWNSIPHESEASQKIHERRMAFGLYNGVTILESLDDQYALGINITSTDQVEEDLFYSKVILKRKLFMKTLKNNL